MSLLVYTHEYTHWRQQGSPFPRPVFVFALKVKGMAWDIYNK